MFKQIVSYFNNLPLKALQVLWLYNIIANTAMAYYNITNGSFSAILNILVIAMGIFVVLLNTREKGKDNGITKQE